MSAIPKSSADPFFPLVVIDADHWPSDASISVIPAVRLPEPFRGLLAHTMHMTETVEAFYDDAVNVKVLSSEDRRGIYHRRILLTLNGTGRIVQFGLVQINLSCCSPEVAARIREEKTPLGRILIEHNVLRRIEPTSFLKVEPGPTLAREMGLTGAPTLYGRTGVIFCDDQPAIAVLEILSPTG
ncbi:hypothetical protein [Zavarzinella formosa]|uniref:hypothetical protein n=1 Tax=Zavarzinella formosa TaxID=360055 RepID=UPI000305D185|nr:hypothetical protein [Zavarzinella formosa]